MILDSTQNSYFLVISEIILDSNQNFYSHVRNDFGFHLKYFMVMSEIILDSTQNILWSH